MAPHLWLRAEVKPNEHRTALTPEACKELLALGFQITVEKSTDPSTLRCYNDQSYVEDAMILGLKELPEDGMALEHTHIYFGHCYKNQGGWKELLHRFNKGNGTLFDMEFLTDDSGRRVAAFGYMAGFAGSFVGLDMWCHQKIAPTETYAAIKPYPNEDALIEYAKGRLQQAAAINGGQLPKLLVMGALGRCGNGACDFAVKAGIPEANLIRWDMAETKAGGPFNAILDADVFVNCIYLSKPIPPFVSEAMLSSDTRRLTVVCDVSCDTSNPHNPIPFANKSTTFDEPAFKVTPAVGSPVDVITIDHLPTLLPKESSDRYCEDLLPSIKELPKLDTNPVWQRAMALFRKKLGEATA